MKLLSLIVSLSISIISLAHAQQQGNNFELSNKSDRPVYFSLSDSAEIFKVMPQTDTKKPTASYITVPPSYQRAPRVYTETLRNFPDNYNGRLITLDPGQSLATYVDTTKQQQLIIARGKSNTELNELALYRFAPNKTLYLKIDKQRKLAPQEGILKPTLKDFKLLQRVSRSGHSLEYNITPEEIKLVQEVTA